MAFVYSQTECCYWYNGMMMRGREQRVNPNAKDTYSLKEENTTVFLYEYSTTSICIERASDLFDEELSLLKDEANNELHENISEGSSFRIVWVKTDHPGDQACLLQSGDPK